MKNFAFASVAAAVFSPEISVGYIGVPLNILFACCAGAFAAFVFGEKVEPRAYMFKLFVACVLMGAALTALITFLIQHWLLPSGKDLPEGLFAGTAAIISCLTRWFVPWLIDTVRTGRWVKWVQRNKQSPHNGE